jgi:hypothetical protein
MPVASRKRFGVYVSVKLINVFRLIGVIDYSPLCGEHKPGALTRAPSWVPSRANVWLVARRGGLPLLE